MKYLKVKDALARKHYKYQELNALAHRFVFIYSNLLKQSEVVSKNFFFCRSKVRRYSKTKIVRRCVFTNRGRAVLRPYSISRTFLRECLLFGVVPGYKKAVW